MRRKGGIWKGISDLTIPIPFHNPTNFFQVRVVQHKQTRDLYALKYINKAKCVRMKAVANVIQERRLLEEVCSFRLPISFILQLRHQVDHPFVVNLRYAFQDDENCFFVLDLMLGGDLRCSSNLHLLPSFPPAHVLYSSLGPIRFFIRGDRSIFHGRALICSMFLAREAHHASVRIAPLALVPLYHLLLCVPPSQQRYQTGQHSTR